MTTTCTATSHETWRAYETGGCVCPSDTRERVAAYKQRTRATDARNAAERRARERSSIAKTKPARQAKPRLASQADRELRERPDLACRHVDDELFYPTGTGGSADAQIKAARAVCAVCPIAAQRLCLQAAMDRGDDHAVLAGTTPRQRREMRQRREVAA